MQTGSKCSERILPELHCPAGGHAGLFAQQCLWQVPEPEACMGKDEQLSLEGPPKAFCFYRAASRSVTVTHGMQAYSEKSMEE